MINTKSKLRTFLLFSSLILILGSCSESSTTIRTDETLLISGDGEWVPSTLQDTLILKTFTDEEANVYAFTGLEVFKASDIDQPFTEISALNNRTIALYQEGSNRIISIQDSSVLASTDGGNNFQEVLFPGLIINSALTDSSELFFSTQYGGIYSYNFSSFSADTLYSPESNENTSLISLTGDLLYVRNERQIKTLQVNSPGFEFKVFEMPTNRITNLIQLQNGTFLAGTERQYVLQSADNGLSWEEISPGQIIANDVTDLAVDENGKVFVSFLGSGIYQFITEDQIWEVFELLNFDLQVYDILLSSEYGPIASTDDGIYTLVKTGDTN